MATKKLKSIKEVVASNVKEIADGITVEKLSSMFFDITKLKVQPEPIYRLDSSGHRYYYKLDKDGEPKFFTSVTTMIRNTLPTSPHLIQWLVSKGGSGAEEAEERAHYGTFLHIQCAELLINGTYDLDKLPKKLDAFAEVNKVVIQKGWVDELKKDVLAFAQFMIDRNVKPLAIEICLSHPTDKYAGAIDLVAELDFGKKRIIGIIDLKSGRKGFYESHEIQLEAYRKMWELQFPDIKVDKIFNWSPTAWRKTPSYKFKDQTDSKNLAKLPNLVANAKIEDAKRDNSVTTVKGKIDLVKGLSDNIEELTFAELIKKNKL